MISCAKIIWMHIENNCSVTLFLFSKQRHSFLEYTSSLSTCVEFFRETSIFFFLNFEIHCLTSRDNVLNQNSRKC